MIVTPDPNLAAAQRTCRTRDGTPKRSYRTRRDARHALASLRRDTGGDGVKPYRCATCGYFHLGHAPAVWKASWDT